MKKSKQILNSIYVSLNNHIDINVEKILEDGVAFDNSTAITSGIEAFLHDIDCNKIDFISHDSTIDSSLAVDNILHCFVLALVEVDPVDFEGNDPLDVKMLMETTAEYIFDSIQSNQVIGVSITE